MPDPGVESPSLRQPLRRATEAEKARIIELYRSGMSMRAIERVVGRSDDSIREILVRAGLTIRHGVRSRILTGERVALAMERHAHGATWAQLGRELGVSGADKRLPNG